MILKNKQEITTPPIDGLPIGCIVPFDGDDIPLGYLECNGQSVSQTTYSYLYQKLRDRHKGTKPTITGEFYLPDLSGKTIYGYDVLDIDYNELGRIGGEKEHSLTISEIPTHSHMGLTWEDEDVSFSTGGSSYKIDFQTSGVVSGSSTFKTGNVGEGQPHNNIPPYLVLRYIIKADIIVLNLNQKNALYDIKTLVLTSSIPDNSEITIPLNYEVGNNSLSVYFMGEKLIKAEGGQDGQYLEVGTSGMLSDTIQFNNVGQTIPSGMTIEFVVLKGYNN